VDSTFVDNCHIFCHCTFYLLVQYDTTAMTNLALILKTFLSLSNLCKLCCRWNYGKLKLVLPIPGGETQPSQAFRTVEQQCYKADSRHLS